MGRSKLYGSESSNRRKKKAPLCYQPLEPRQLLATLNVTTFNDVVNPNDGVLSLREAVTLANSNGQSDVIQLAAGDYMLSLEGINEQSNQTGDIDILPDDGHRVEIVGAGLGSTTVTGVGDRVFEAHNGSDFGLANLTVTGGDLSGYTPLQGRRGGAVAVYGSELTLDQVKIADNNLSNPSKSVAGGLYASDSNFSITGSEFTNNVASLFGHAMFFKRSTGVIEQSNIHDHRAFGSNFSIFAIYASESNFELNQSKFDFNPQGIGVSGGSFSMDHSRIRHPSGQGIVGDKANITVNDSRFVNLSRGIVTEGAISRALVTNSFFTGNTIGINSYGTRLNIHDSIFQSNYQPIIGRGANADFNYQANLTNLVFDDSNSRWVDITATKGHLHLEDFSMINVPANTFRPGTTIQTVSDTATIRNIEVIGRVLSVGMDVEAKTLASIVDVRLSRTGGLNLHGNVDVHNVSVTNSVNSVAVAGGSIYWQTTAENQTLNVTNTLLANNFSRNFREEAGGAALYIDSNHSATANILSSTIVSNRSRGGGNFHHAGQGNVNLNIHNSIIWNNSENEMLFGNINLNATHNIVSNMDPAQFDPAQGNFSTNPNFVSFQAGNFRLKGASPAVDAGDSSQLIADIYDVDRDADTAEFGPDLDSLDRVFGAETDIGAFEFAS